MSPGSDLQQAYREAIEAWTESGESDVWDEVAGDGLEDLPLNDAFYNRFYNRA